MTLITSPEVYPFESSVAFGRGSEQHRRPPDQSRRPKRGEGCASRSFRGLQENPKNLEKVYV